MIHRANRDEGREKPLDEVASRESQPDAALERRDSERALTRFYQAVHDALIEKFAVRDEAAARLYFLAKRLLEVADEDSLGPAFLTLFGIDPNDVEDSRRKIVRALEKSLLGTSEAQARRYFICREHLWRLRDRKLTSQLKVVFCVNERPIQIDLRAVRDAEAAVENALLGTL